MKDRKLPKSLHTVTVLTAIAAADVINLGAEPAKAVRAAVELLGLENLPDEYGLIEAAIKQVSKCKPQVFKVTHKGIDAPYIGPAAIRNLSYRGSDFS